MPPRMYRVTVILQGTQRKIVGPASSITDAGADFDRIAAAQGHGGTITGVDWLSPTGRLVGRNVKEIALTLTDGDGLEVSGAQPSG